MSKEVMELALEALETVAADVKTTPTAYEAQRQAITALREALVNEALDKKAENAREIGLDYEPAQQEPVAYLCENAVGHKYFRWKKPSSTYKPIALYTSPPVQQEPVGSVYRYGKDSSGKQWHGIRWTASGLDLPDGTLIYTSPPAQRTWVGLTDEERDDLLDTYITAEGRARAIEAAHNIKENT